MKITIKWPRDRADGQLWERELDVSNVVEHVEILLDNAGEVRTRRVRETVASDPAPRARVELPAREDYATVWRGLVDLTARVESLETDRAELRRIVRRLRKRLRVVDEPNGHGDQIVDLQNASRAQLPAEIDALDPPCNHPPCGHRAHEHVGAISRSGMTGCVHLEPLPGVTPDRADLGTMPTSCPCARSREEVLHQTPSNEE